MRVCPFCGQEVGQKKLSTRINANFGYICFISWVGIVGALMVNRYLRNEVVDFDYFLSIGVPALIYVFVLVVGGLFVISFFESKD